MLKQQLKRNFALAAAPKPSEANADAAQKKDPKQIRRLGSVSCCLNSGLSDRTTGCRGMGSRPVGLRYAENRLRPGEYNAYHVLVLLPASKGAGARKGGSDVHQRG